MRFTSAGYVGIGNTSPARALTVGGPAATLAVFNSSINATVTLDAPSGGYSQIDVSGSNDFRINTNSIERFRINTATGTVTTTQGLGYGTGAGGAVTQTINRSTGVTLNKICGSITLSSNAGTTTATTFTVTNSLVAATDVVFVCQKSGTDKYITLVTNVSAGSFAITAYTTGGTTTEQPVLNFTVIKAVNA